MSVRIKSFSASRTDHFRFSLKETKRLDWKGLYLQDCGGKSITIRCCDTMSKTIYFILAEKLLQEAKHSNLFHTEHIQFYNQIQLIHWNKEDENSHQLEVILFHLQTLSSLTLTLKLLKKSKRKQSINSWAVLSHNKTESLSQQNFLQKQKANYVKERNPKFNGSSGQFGNSLKGKNEANQKYYESKKHQCRFSPSSTIYTTWRGVHLIARKQGKETALSLCHTEKKG